MGAYIFAGALVGAGELLALVVRWIDDMPERRERRKTGESRLEQARRRNCRAEIHCPADSSPRVGFDANGRPADLIEPTRRFGRLGAPLVVGKSLERGLGFFSAREVFGL